MKILKPFESWRNVLDEVGNYVVIFRTVPESKLQREIVKDVRRSEAIKNIVSRFPECKIQSVKKV